MAGVFKARLVLTAQGSMEKWTYLLEGEATDPPAVDHISKTCRSGQRSSISIDVPNHSDVDIVYQVFTDLPVVQGDSMLTVPAGGSQAYHMTVWAMISGMYTGTVTFTNSNGNYEWFTLALEVLEPPKLASFDVEAIVGAAKEITVHVDNPCAEEIKLSTTYGTSSSLFGPDTHFMAPYESKDIKFYFSPVEPGSTTSHVKLANPVVGEFWYGNLPNGVLHPRFPNASW